MPSKGYKKYEILRMICEIKREQEAMFFKRAKLSIQKGSIVDENGYGGAEKDEKRGEQEDEHVEESGEGMRKEGERNDGLESDGKGGVARELLCIIFQTRGWTGSQNPASAQPAQSRV